MASRLIGVCGSASTAGGDPGADVESQRSLGAAVACLPPVSLGRLPQCRPRGPRCESAIPTETRSPLRPVFLVCDCCNSAVEVRGNPVRGERRVALSISTPATKATEAHGGVHF